MSAPCWRDRCLRLEGTISKISDGISGMLLAGLMLPVASLFGPAFPWTSLLSA